ncbi:DNA topoisomerase 4 subunit B [Symmachiella macrocystis]|uniref:DNA topoisomerase (ATP-hydrolyzing) n=1 Tax=Symmachiella macrocystis TaxID=2527985 RepID=A0A5C6BLQ9_9PLAN|nr:hypothetical protein [Symmachiella macrocystis]TWU12607.1 DNA topoisomerase 4 subunit B [Symmachiella macrocystis]
MSSSRDNTRPIKSLSATDGIRDRPAMYLSEFGQPHAVNSLLQECLCISLDNAFEGCATEIRITLRKDGSIAIWDNGPPLPLIGSDGLPAIQPLLTKLNACRDAKRAVHKDLCRVGVVVVNALSEWLKVDCGIDARHWRQEYQQGSPAGPFVDIGDTTETWEQISFLPDRSLLGETQFDIPTFQRWFTDQQFAISNCRITLEDDVTDERILLS